MIVFILVLARTLHIGSALLMVSLLFFQTFILDPKWTANGLHLILRWLIASWLVHVFSGLLWFWLVAVQMGDDSWLSRLNLGFLQIMVTQTQFGRLWFWRMAFMPVLGLIFLTARQSDRSSFRDRLVWREIALILSGFLLISLVWAGHAASGIHYRALHISVDAFHLALAAVWPGGLVPLAIFLHMWSKNPQSTEWEDILKSLNRFSCTSLMAVLFLFVTGLINACLLVPNLSALFTSGYGQLLLSKIILSLVMIGLGGINRLRFLPELKASRCSLMVFSKFRRVVLIENLLGLTVLFIVGSMGTTAPP